MKDVQPTKTVWTTRELAEAAVNAGKPITQEYIRQLCKRGVISAQRPGRDWLIGDDDARFWLESWLGNNQI
jgi:hypothetical protein